MSNYFLYICKNKFLLIKTDVAMGNNSQSNIMKKLLLLGIIALTALFTACEKDKPEDNSNSSTYGFDISTLDINDPNYYYWKISFTLVDCKEDSKYEGIVYYDCLYATNKELIEEIIPMYKYEEEMSKQYAECTYKFKLISRITLEECEKIAS